LIDRPVNVATPAIAVFVTVPARAPLPGLVPMAIVIDAELPVIVLPPASCTATTGWGLSGALTTALPGLVVKPTFAAEPTVILKVALVAPVSPVLDPVNV
jgi:hypothetical protein